MLTPRRPQSRATPDPGLASHKAMWIFCENFFLFFQKAIKGNRNGKPRSALSKHVHACIHVVVQDMQDTISRPRSTPVRRVHMEDTDAPRAEEPVAGEPEQVPPLQQLPIEVRQGSLGIGEDHTPQHHIGSYKYVESSWQQLFRAGYNPASSTWIEPYCSE